MPKIDFWHARPVTADGNGRAVPVFEGEKWRRLDSNLTYRISFPSAFGGLGRLRGLLVFMHSK